MAPAVLSRQSFAAHEPVVATKEERAELVRMAKVLLGDAGRSPARKLRLVGPDNEMIELPEPVFRILRQVVVHLARGDGVALVPVHRELTTQQAADLLNVSRPHLISLLDRGEIAYTRTEGDHRRIRFGDLMAFKKRRNAERKAALDRLAQMTEDFGLYESGK